MFYTGVGSISLLQGIFQTQGLNPGLLHFRQILYHLSHQRSPIPLEDFYHFLKLCPTPSLLHWALSTFWKIALGL